MVSRSSDQLDRNLPEFISCFHCVRLIESHQNSGDRKWNIIERKLKFYFCTTVFGFLEINGYILGVYCNYIVGM